MLVPPLLQLFVFFEGLRERGRRGRRREAQLRHGRAPEPDRAAPPEGAEVGRLV